MLIVVTLLTLIRHVAEHILKSKVQLKVNQVRLVRYFSFTKQEISAILKLFSS